MRINWKAILLGAMVLFIVCFNILLLSARVPRAGALHNMLPTVLDIHRPSDASPSHIHVTFDKEDLAAVKKGKVFLSKGNSEFASKTAAMRLNRGATGGIGLTFIVVGDWGGPGRGVQLTVAKEMDTFATSMLSKPSAPLTTRQYKRLRLFPVDHPDMFTDAKLLTIKHHTAAQGLITPLKGKLFGDMFAGNDTVWDSVQTESRLDFVISTGDNMYESGVNDYKDVRFKRNFELVYHHDSLQCPWLMSLGNHDHGAHGILQDVQGQVNYTFCSPRWYLPSTFYSQRVEEISADGATSVSLEVFIMDSYEVSPSLTRVTNAQIHWLNASLAASTADWLIVVCHRPIYSAGAKHGSSPYMYSRLHPILEQHRVAAVLSGDDHELQVMRDDNGLANATRKSGTYNALYLLSGGGARAKDDLKPHGVKGKTVFQAGKHGFMAVHLVDGNTLSLSVLSAAGATLFESDFSNPRVPAGL